ncbi:DUF4839 domain-containing protein [Olsenella uli]|uniref:DUF4839 domain-containing protein n=1 Tax=Olsenella uli TaxID=133926 RepID=UPI0019563B2E|nr:DUF4839 domain-containing protein [Olsenella uli]MBM6817208.1 DUF4839 domain-containing protein [Olsenella uli]
MTKSSGEEMRVSGRQYVNRALATLCALALTLGLGGCGGDGTSEEPTQSGGSAVSITIECESNLMLSRYDLDVYVDDAQQGSLDHGTTKTFDLVLNDGTHALRITEKGDSSVDGSVDFSVSGETSLKYVAHCTNSQVEVEAVNALNPPISSSEASSKYHDEARRAFEEAGFTNIREEELRDLMPGQQSSNWYTDNITIGGRDEFSEEDSFPADDEVVITYHVLADLNAPASSSELEGRNYEDVVSMFEDAGFINVTTRTTGASGAAGTVSEVCIGGLFGSSDFAAEDTFAFDSGVEITYFEGSGSSDESSGPAPVPEGDLNRLLEQSEADASWFSSAYKGSTITFDGWVAHLVHHDNFDTRWDVLILPGDSGDSSTDLSLRLTDVSMSDMNVVNSDTLRMGDNITITAVVGDYNETAAWLELDPVSITIR